MIAFSELIKHRKDRALCRLVKHISFSYIIVCAELKVSVTEMVLVPELVCLSLIPSVVFRQRSLFFFFFFRLFFCTREGIGGIGSVSKDFIMPRL